ncbi:MAG: hypothetical protein ACKVP3_02095 [Hyphomicrobiaceae bacterium]
MQIKTNQDIAATELRSLSQAELDSVTGGAVNCFPIFGEDGSVYSPTLGRLNDPRFPKGGSPLPFPKFPLPRF